LDVRERYEAQKEARRRRAQEREPMPIWWLGQRDPVARFSKWLMIWTALLFVGTIGSGIILYKTDITLQNTTVTNERPWLKLEIEPAGDFSYSTELGIDFLIKVNIKNIGKTPALYANIDATLIAVGFVDVISAKTRQEICEYAKNGSVASVGYMIFPNEEISLKRVVNVTPEEAPLFFEMVIPNSNPPKYMLRPATVIACVGYVSTFSKADAYSTGIVARLGQRFDNNSVGFSLIMTGTSIPEKDIRINRAFSFVGDEAK